MEARCEGCAGCCLDWRPLLEDARDALAGGREVSEGSDREPLDDVYNLVPLTRDEVRAFVDAGLADALTPRLWHDEDGVEIDGHRVAAVRDRPVFFVGPRKPPKPVAPFDREGEAWLPTCVFLDPTTLQCRIHGDELYPDECADYPAHNLALEAETECERVERATGTERLLDGDESSRPDGGATVDVDPDDAGGILLGPEAVGAKLFAHPRPDDLDGAVDRIARGEPTAADRAEFVAVAAASSPGTLAFSEPHYERAREAALAADSWVGRAIDEWSDRADESGSSAPSAALAERVEEGRGAPETPGWDELRGE